VVLAPAAGRTGNVETPASRSRTIRLVSSLGIALLAIGAFSAGRHLQGLHGFDPPYSTFWLGFALELTAYALPVMSLAGFMFLGRRRAHP
jgi:hypothetical protein